MTTCIARHLSPERTGTGTLARTARCAPAWAVALALVACGDSSPPAAAPASTPAAVASPGPAAVEGRPAVGSSSRRGDPRWAAALAEAEDEGAAAALAGHVGFAALADALADEDAVRALALRALPHADRADLALGALGAALHDGRGDRGGVADAIEGALVASRRDVENGDAAGVVRCAEALERAAATPGGGLEGERARGLARRVRERARH